MNVIPDTSIWIEYFKGKTGYLEECRTLIETERAYTIEIIFAELLQGAISTREVNFIKEFYQSLPKINIEEMYLLAGEFSRTNKLTTKGISLIDACIITACIEAKCKLWTLDKKIIFFLNSEYLYVHHL